MPMVKSVSSRIDMSGHSGERLKNRDDDETKAGHKANGSQPKRRRTTDWFDVELFRAGRVDQPTNHYFVTRTKLSKTDELYVPKSVVKLYDLDLPAYTVFIDDRGQEYPSKLHIWKDRRMFYVGGWRELCTDNFVGVYDKIICEFIRGRDGELHIYVHFIRANGD